MFGIMTQGRAMLLEWFRRSRKQKQELAATIGISKPYMSQILMGNRRPKLEHLMAIEAATGVPVTSWSDTRRGKADRAKKHSAKDANVSR